MVLMESHYETIQHGDTAPDFRLRGTDGKIYSPNSFNGAKGILIIFMCNHCPYVKAKLNAINKLAVDFKAKGLAVVGINPNDSAKYPDDSFDSMQQLMKDRNFAFTYLHDETQETARAYDAVCTPDPFLFDRDFRLVYHGRIDDGHGPDAPVTRQELREAIEQLFAGEEITVEEHPSMGCSIKWKLPTENL